ncbi:MAG: T9SS type A sorting domain-containing protein [Bacteroidetes bacterium]|nr:T9SS type A sorting domain-containing protein [Bacteroidota bacterium]
MIKHVIKEKVMVYAFIGLMMCGDILSADTVIFTKDAYADWTLEDNQDRITDSVWVTRKDNQSIFNIAREDGYSGSSGSPVGTLWADTTTAAAAGSYTNFVTMNGGSPQSIIGDTVSLYLPADDLYFDVVFLSWGGGNSGGAFSYSRTSIDLAIDDVDMPKGFLLSENFPNPFNPTTTFSYELPIVAPVVMQVYDLNGRMVLDHNAGIKPAGQYTFVLDAAGLASGVYFCVFTAGEFHVTQKIMLMK